MLGFKIIEMPFIDPANEWYILIMGVAIEHIFE
ncbi:MAG: hypothetical protein ACI8R9_000913 [Paraglaciecola sp.]|jgi:hypothetical protein